MLSGASVRVQSNFTIGDSELRLHLSGPEDCLLAARDAILSRVSEWNAKASLPSPTSTSTTKSTSEDGQGDEGRDFNRQSSVKILLTADAAGWLFQSVDAAGENICQGIRVRTGGSPPEITTSDQ